MGPPEISSDNDSSAVSIDLPEVQSNDPVEQRRITIEVKVTDANGKMVKDLHVITVRQ